MSNMTRYRLLKLLSMALYILPFAVLIAFNYRIYLNFEVTKISLYGYLIILLIVVAIKDKMFMYAKSNPSLSLAIVIFITSLIMKQFADELLLISLTAILGSTLSALVEPVVMVYFNVLYDFNGTIKHRVQHDKELRVGEALKRAYR